MERLKNSFHPFSYNQRRTSMVNSLISSLREYILLGKLSSSSSKAISSLLHWRQVRTTIYSRGKWTQEEKKIVINYEVGLKSISVKFKFQMEYLPSLSWPFPGRIFQMCIMSFHNRHKSSVYRICNERITVSLSPTPIPKFCTFRHFV